MGVPGLWEALKPAAATKSLTQLAVTDGFEPNHGGHRGFRVGIDASIWFFHAQVFKGMQTDVGENPELRTLFFRCAKLMGTPLLPLFVFDGPKRPQWKRGKRISTKKDSWLVTGMQSIINAFGYEWRYAPGEAEAELAYLNRIGVIDAVLTDDVDTFLFGATMLIRNPSNTLSGNRSNPIKNAEGKEDGNHVLTFKSCDLKSRSDIQLTHGGLILIGLLRGGDYHQAGVPGVGITIAHGLARCGFGDSLVEAVRTMSDTKLDAFLAEWRADMQRELRTNSRGIIGKKLAKLASSFPQDFPDLKVVDAYVNPAVSASSGHVTNIEWRREPNLSDLAKLCELYFEWGYKDMILKRFRTVIWPGAVCRILRRSVIQADDLAEAVDARRTASGGTPTKKRVVLAQGTPSKMITEHFSRLDIHSPAVRAFDEPDATPLITKIHSERRHASTDKLKEYRLEIAPLQLARLAEQGITGARPAPEVNPYLDDADDDDGDEEDEGQTAAKKKRAPKLPPEPETVLRVWMPACMVELVEPQLVHDFEDVQERKRLKKEGKAVPKKSRSTKDGEAAAPSRGRKSAKAATKSKYLSDIESESSGSDEDLRSAPAHRISTTSKTKATTGTTNTKEAPPPSKLNTTYPLSRPSASQKPSRSSAANKAQSTASSSRSKAAMVADLFAPSSPSTSKTTAGFFSDDSGASTPPKLRKATIVHASKAAKPPREQPLFLPTSSDEELDIAQKRTKRGARGSDSDTVHKSPRKNKLQTSPRAARKRAEPLFLPGGSDSDSDVESPASKITRAPFVPRLTTTSSAKALVKDVIEISSDESDARPVLKFKYTDGVIDLT